MDIPFHVLTVRSVHAETPELFNVVVEADAALRELYIIPGQYAQIKAGGLKPGFFAFASAPGDSVFQFLIKRGSPISDAIISHKTGETVQVSAPQGKGYPIGAARGRDVLLIGVGSGIAPLRALLEMLLKERAEYGKISLTYGARTQCAFPYENDFKRWVESGVSVTRICSQPRPDTWSGGVGRVQSVLLADAAPLTSGCVAFVCGMKTMVEDVKSALAQRGLPADRVFQNF